MGNGARVGVFEVASLEVAKDDFVFLLSHNIIRVYRNFSAASGAINDELRDGVAGGVTTQALNDFNSIGNRSSQVRRAIDGIALVEIIWAHTAHQEFVDEFFLNLYGVVYAFEQDALIAHGHTCVGKATKSIADLAGVLRRGLARMARFRARNARGKHGW